MAEAKAPLSLTDAEKTFIEIVMATVNEYRANRNDSSSLSEVVRLLLLGVVANIESQIRVGDSMEAKFAGVMAFGIVAKSFNSMCEEAALRVLAMGAKPQ